MADVYYAICEASWWASPNWAGKGSEAARDAFYDGTFTSGAAWEGARDGPSSAGDTEYGEITGPWTADDTSQITFAGWDSGLLGIVLQTVGDSKHTGEWDETTAHRFVSSPTSHILRSAESNVSFIGLQLKNELTSTANARCIYLPDAVTGIKIADCILVCDDLGPVIEFDNSSLMAQMWNDIIYSGGSAVKGIFIDYASIVAIYNTVVNDCVNGIQRDTGTVTVINSVSFENTDDFVGSFSSIDYCASDDGDGTNAVTAPTWTDEFTDHANYDYTLKAENILEDAGTDDPGSGLYSNDIIDVAYTTTWPIGVFEESAAGDALLKILNETEQVSEARQRNISFTRVNDETEQVSEARQRNITFNRVLDEDEQVTEIDQRNISFTVVINEIVNIIENVLRNFTLSNIVNETTQIAENILRFTGVVRVVNEVITISHSVVTKVTAIISAPIQALIRIFIKDNEIRKMTFDTNRRSFTFDNEVRRFYVL